MTPFEWILIGSGICWTVTYLLIIAVGFRDRTYGMPLAALCANLSWEFIFAQVHPHQPPQVIVNHVWLAFDLIIAAQTLWYGAGEWRVPKWLFLCAFAVSLATAYGGVLLVTREFAELDKWSGAYAAFGQNLMMSILFVEFFRNRPDLRGQSLWIAGFKLLGTMLASAAFWQYSELGKSPLMRYLFVSILAFDMLYLLLLWNRWRRSPLIRPALQTEPSPRRG